MENSIPYSGLANMLDAVVGHASIGFNGAKVFPFTNAITPTLLTVAADLTPATFNGAAAKTITWGAPYKNADGVPEVMSGLETFTTDGVIDETVYGLAVVDGADATLLRDVIVLSSPKRMEATTDVISAVVRLTMSPAGFGSSIQVSE